MQKRDISLDDIEDVRQMSRKLEEAIRRTLNGNELSLAISALLSATVNSIIDQCETLEQVEHYHSVFIKVFEVGMEQFKSKYIED